jgi:oligopeptidase B
MRLHAYVSIVVLCVVVLACQGTTQQQLPADIDPPVAKVQPKKLEIHGDARIDNYFWLNQREDPEVISYLEAENEYTEAMMAHTENLQQVLVDEFMERIKQTDMSVPYKLDDYYYYSRTEEGKEYPIYCRKKGSLDAAEEVLLEVNELAAGHKFFAVGQRAISYDQDILAFSVDTAAREIYTIRFRNLVTGEQLSDEIPEVTSNVAWTNDNKTLFYAKQDPVTLRSYQIFRHVLGTDPVDDELVYEEKDDTFSVGVWRTKSKKYMIIESTHTLSTEILYLDASNPGGEFTVFQPRERDHEYSIDHYGDFFYIRTNHEAKNFRLMKTSVTLTGKKHWNEVIPHRDDVLLEGFEIFKNYLVVEERKNGLMQLRVRPWSGKGEHYIDFGEPAYLVFARNNYEFDTPVLRYQYESMTTPDSVYDYDMETKEKTLLKQDEVLGGFESNNYVTERLYATARDDTKIPISIVYRKGTPKDGSHPLLLYGYGSYGSSEDATFSPYLVSLLDRGFIYALAHIRGGAELGRSWYEDGKLFNKKNTFTDFIDCAEYFVKQNYTRPERLFIDGGSAGGLLIGAVVNMRPDLFEGAIAEVPFVDVVTTMLDESVPLTTGEYDEWGDPRKKDYYEYMLSYSPYDNVEAKDYPNMLVTTSLHDSQVQYFEPAKWVAKLRVIKTDDNLLLLRTRMEAGHGGVSGRYKRYKQTAFQYAFLLDRAGIGG